jgi:TonB family protein
MLSFTVDRKGQILNPGIVNASHRRELENEAMLMIERAQPLPPFPASMPQARLDLVVPILFLPPDEAPDPCDALAGRAPGLIHPFACRSLRSQSYKLRKEDR